MRTIVYTCLILILACSDVPEEAGSGGEAPASNTPSNLLADFAGTWDVRTMAENSDSVLTTYRLFATTSTTGWTFKFDDSPDTLPIQMVSVRGDSVVTRAGPFPSALRSGVMVTTEGVSWLENGMLRGRTVAHYSTGGPDSILTLRNEGSRAP